MSEIYLAGGCFWGTQHYLRQINGVIATCAGYANGNTENPTYKEVYTDTTGYAETVRVEYNPDIIGLELLLRLYFDSINPTSLNKQGGDEGTRYRTGIYYTSTADLPTIRKVYAEVEERIGEPLAVEVEPLRGFYPAEEYHQDYLINNPGGYCHLPKALFDYARKANNK
jgi:peptide methionine sulfoxide reductase msrA/msrB